MKKLITLVAIASMLVFGTTKIYAQEPAKENTATTEQVADTNASDSNAVTEAEAIPEAPVEEEVIESKSFHQVLKEKFIAGGAGWMTPILLVLVLGLALVVERVLYLQLSKCNTKKLLEDVEEALKNNDVEKAKEVCRSTRGPVASVFYQGLDRFNEGIDVIEKSIVSYGSVQMGRLESNLSWIGLCIALAPSLGFLGTVVGMVAAFDDIEAAGDISPTVVAGGMKVALITTVFGLISAIILQFLNNIVISLIEKLVNDMEDSTISFMDIVTKVKSNN